MEIKTAPNLSQIIPLTQPKPQRLRQELRLKASPKLTTAEKLTEARIEIDQLKRDLEMREGELAQLKMSTESTNRQWIERCRAKDRCLNDEVEFLETGLRHGIWENRIQMKRRISHLKGARDFQGSIEGVERESSKWSIDGKL